MSKTYETYNRRMNFKGSDLTEYVEVKNKEKVAEIINSQFGRVVNKDDKSFKIAINATGRTHEENILTIIGYEEDVQLGDLLTLENEDWIVTSKQTRAVKGVFKGSMYKTNMELKWKDIDGVLNTIPAYVRKGTSASSMGTMPTSEDKVNEVIARGSGRDLFAVTPRNNKVQIGTRFIIGSEAYRTANIDDFSLEKINVLTLQKDFLTDYDDVIEKIAITKNTDWEIVLTEEAIAQIGVPFQPSLSIYKDGLKLDSDFYLVKNGKNYQQFTFNSLGDDTIRVVLKDNPNIYKDIDVLVLDAESVSQEIPYITGPNTISWNSTNTYEFTGSESVEFELWGEMHSKYQLEQNGNTATVSVSDRIFGELELTAKGDNNYTKIIKIRTV